MKSFMSFVLCTIVLSAGALVVGARTTIVQRLDAKSHAPACSSGLPLITTEAIKAARRAFGGNSETLDQVFLNMMTFSDTFTEYSTGNMLRCSLTITFNWNTDASMDNEKRVFLNTFFPPEKIVYEVKVFDSGQVRTEIIPMVMVSPGVKVPIR